jgi:hypothetical protein
MTQAISEQMSLGGVAIVKSSQLHLLRLNQAQSFQVTHVFHPLHGRELTFVVRL